MMTVKNGKNTLKSKLPDGGEIGNGNQKLNPNQYLKYLRSPEWKRRRDLALRDAGNRCQICNSDNDLDVHHRTYENIGNEKSQDLTVLCRMCHGMFHGKIPQGKTIKLTRNPKDGGTVGIHFLEWDIGNSAHIEIGELSLYALYDALSSVENIPEKSDEDMLHGWYEYNELIEVLEDAIYIYDEGKSLSPKVLKRVRDKYIKELQEGIIKDNEELEKELKLVREEVK